YSKHSRLVTEIIAESAPLFEKASIDEFYIDVTGMERFFGTFRWAQELRKKVINESGLPISLGLSVNKLVSKVATGEFKPNAEKHIIEGTEKDFLAPLSIAKIPMIGKKTARFLYDMGVRDVKTLREMPVKYLQSAFGKNGLLLWKRAHAIDDSPVEPYSERKSISTESTFSTDTIDVVKLRSIIIAMVEKLAYKLREKHKLTSNIAIKLRYSNFDTETRQKQIPYTASDQVLMHTALEMFEKLYSRRMLLRLVGVRLSGLVHGNYQIDLFEDTEESIKLYQAMDKIRFRYGNEKIVRAVTLDVKNRVQMDMDVFTD
ncbi:MAG: DNA polymerase IV, partial [Cyclobacteriaceae bacterium]|nr:DNA polymerase IV [Cyclobacteriaceae bacterium]